MNNKEKTERYIQSSDYLYTKYPKLLRYDKRLSNSDKSVWLVLNDMVFLDNVFPSINTISILSDVHPRRVSMSIKNLVNNGWLNVERRKRMTNYYHITAENVNCKKWIGCLSSVFIPEVYKTLGTKAKYYYDLAISNNIKPYETKIKCDHFDHLKSSDQNDHANGDQNDHFDGDQNDHTIKIQLLKNNNKNITKVIPFQNLHQKFISELLAHCNKEVSYNPINKVKEQQAISELMFKQIQPVEIANLFNALSVIKSKGIKDRYINSLPYTIESVWKRADDIMGIYSNIESRENYGRTSDTMFGIELEEM
jgi:hypothetical protein